MRFLLGVLMLMISGSALATIDVLQFKDEAQEQQFRQLTEETALPEMPEQQHCRFQLDDCHRPASESV
ncbi:cytochrome C-type biogenesis protein [Escherichia coli]|nr:cytochrome C-type biogenesis protein [Escherichia coli]